MNKLLLLSTLLSISTYALGESVSKKSASSSPKYGQVTANQALETLLEIPDVKTKYDECVNEKSTDMGTCVWKKVSLDVDLKKQVQEKYNKLSIKENKESANRAPAAEETKEEKKSSIAAKKINLSNNYADDPQVKALTAFYKKKLDEVLTPEKTPDVNGKASVATVDHKLFTELYESELGRTIVNAFTQYCLETDAKCGTDYEENGEWKKYSCELPETTTAREENRKANLSSLKASTTSFSNPEEASKWQYCITNVSDICANKSGYSQQRACLIVDYVKSARESLLVVGEQNKFWNENAEKGSISSATNFHVIDKESNKKATTDYLATITANDVTEVSKKVDEDRMALIDQCFTEGKDGEKDKINDAEACKAFLNTNKEDSEKALAEFTLRQSLQADLIKERLESSEDKESLKQYLLNEGYTEAQAAALIAENDPKMLVDKINTRFKNEKEALIKEMKERVGSKTSAEEGKVTEADLDNLKTIKKELSSRTSDLAQSVQFNNIVSSYLDFTAYKNGKIDKESSGRNVASLFAEVESMQKDEKNKDTAKILQEKIDEAQLKEPKSSITLSMENLNSKFLSYFGSQKNPKKEKEK